MKIVSVMILLTVLVASQVALSQRRKTATTPRTNTRKTTQSTNEANDEAIRTWNKYFLKCGDSYYCELSETLTNLRKPFCEYRFVSITTRELPLSEPDRLNGIERKLISEFTAKAERCYLTYYYHDYPDEWEKWGSGIQLSVNLIKQSGDWTAMTNYPFPPTSRSKKSCAEFSKPTGDRGQPAPLTDKTAYEIPARFRLKDEGNNKGSSWSRIDSTTWVETFSDGRSYRFRVLERTTIGGFQGTVLRRNSDNLDIFVPDINSGSTLVKFRAQGNSQWAPLREMVDVEPR